MRVRKAMLALLSLSPVFILAGLGIIGRTQQIGWKFEEYSPRDQHILYSYRTAGLKTIVLQERLVERTPERISAMLDEWIAASQDAGTTSLPMSSLHDQGQTGPKFDLMTTKGLGAHLGTGLASEQAAAGDYEGAAETLTKVITIAQIGRDGGFSCVIDTCRDTLPALTALTDVAHHLSDEDRAGLVVFLDRMHMDEELTEAVLKRMEKLENKQRVMESPELGVIVANASDGQIDPAKQAATYRRLIYEAGQFDSSIAPLSRMAQTHQESVRKRLNRLYSELLNP